MSRVYRVIEYRGNFNVLLPRKMKNKIRGTRDNITYTAIFLINRFSDTGYVILFSEVNFWAAVTFFN